jgi:protein-L-isoaspartate(D-aspartate) O-methyltransferase
MKEEREQMVYEIKKRYSLESSDVLSVMLQVPRHKFVSEKYKDIAYRDSPVPIGQGQTMSQPYTVAFMTQLLDLTGKERVLEIGTGSGYQAAILSKLAGQVYTMEIVPELAKKAERTLKMLGFKNVHVKSSSGEWGWEEHAPYEAIMVTAGVEGEVPEELFDQLKEGGVLVAPVGKGHDKKMTKFTKIKKQGKEEIRKEEFGTFHFVPFVEEEN